MGNYLQYNRFDLANGPGVRNSLFVAGCSLHCKGCWNPESWNRNNGYPFTDNMLHTIISDLNHPAVQGLSVLGGEPFENLDILCPLLKNVKKQYGEEKNVWVWSGYEWAEILNDPEKNQVLDFVDVLVAGRFVLAERDLTLQFRGSRNQQVIDVKNSIGEKISTLAL